MLFCFAPMFTRGMERNDVKHIPVPPGRGNPTPPGRPKTLKCCHASVSSSTLLCPCLGGPCLLWDCLQMLVTSSHRLGIPSPAVTQLRALLPLPIFKTYIKKAFFFFILFFFQGVFACQSERDVFDLCAWAPTPAKTAWPFQESMLRSSHAYNDTDIHTVTQGI